jgi:UDP-N-acetylmuramoyl-tripeptide--D-alanyl-D-alanine ligase
MRIFGGYGVLHRFLAGLAFRATPLYRALLVRPLVIAVTGSQGKSTAVRMIGQMLAERSPRFVVSHHGPETMVAGTVRRVRPWHSHYVQELSGDAPGKLARILPMVRPKIGVVTNVSTDHFTNFRDLDVTAEEKGTLVAALPADGVAVLNADDPRVRAMAGRTRARVLTYGLAEEAEVRGSAVHAAWPEALSLDVTYHGDTRRIETRLLGEHWTMSVLAATAAALAAGVTLGECARRAPALAPTPGRMEPVETPAGAVFINDCWKAPFSTIPTVIRFMETARANRKFMVFGTISDYAGAGNPKYRRVARDALAVADEVCFVGPNSGAVRKLAAGDGKGRVFRFDNTKALADHLEGRLHGGDLVLLKASVTDHLERIARQHTIGVACWRERCGKRIMCEECGLRLVPAPPPQVNGAPLDAKTAA